MAVIQQEVGPTRTRPTTAGRKPGDAGLRYMPALDGIRALAVGAVIAYHSQLAWASGGFLGVDVFFVLSGFLITALLLADQRKAGRVRLGRFWGRRARRLLPPLIVLLVGVAIVVPLLASEEGYRLRSDLLAALAYVSNWRLIFEHQSYFASTGRPPLLQHLWSLAVEEQFYLLWPLVLAVVLGFSANRRRIGLGILAAAGLSAVLMALIYAPEADPSRVYYGTDTRVQALLIGAGLAFLLTKTALRPVGRTRIALEVAGAASLVGLGVCVAKVNEFQAGLYRGGFLGVAILAAVLIGVCAQRRTIVGTALGVRPLVWLGKRSYGIYLWFWPVFMLTRPHADIELTGYPLLALRVAITVALAAASYRLIEAPIRNGTWRNARVITINGSPRIVRPAVLWGLVAAVTIAAIGTGVLISHKEPPAPSYLTNATSATGPSAATSTTVAAGAPAPAPATEPVSHGHVLAIGESVLLEAKAALAAKVPGITVDAVVARQAGGTLAAVKALRQQGLLGDEVIIQVGNNGRFTNEQFDELMAQFDGVRRVVVVNLKVPRSWEGPNNQVINAGVTRWSNAVLVDWHAYGTAHPGIFGSDGVHMTPAGVPQFVDLMVNAL